MRRNTYMKLLGLYVIIYKSMKVSWFTWSAWKIGEMNVVKIIKHTLILLAAVFMAACVTTPSTGDSAESKQPVSQKSKKAYEPEIVKEELTPELLYQYLLAEIAIQRGQMDEALNAYRWIINCSNDYRLIRRAVRVAMSEKHYIIAEAGLDKWSKLTPKDPVVNYYVAQLALRSKNKQKAIDSLKRFVQSSEDNKELVFSKVVVLLSYEKNHQLAFDVMTGVLQAFPNDQYALLAYAEVGYVAGKYPQSMEVIKRVVEIDPDNNKARILLVRIASELEDKQLVLKEMHNLVKRFSNNVEVRLMFARLLIVMSEYGQAADQMKIAVEMEPDNITVLLTAAPVLVEIGEHIDFAKQHLLKSLKSAEKNETAYYYLGRIEENEDNVEQAIDWYEQVKQGDRATESQLRVASLLADLGDLDAALSRLDEMKNENPKLNIQILLMEAEILKNAKRPADGIALLSAALQKNTGSAEILYARAMLAEMVDDMGMLERDLRQIIKDNPQNAHALNALGYSLADRTERYAEAKELIEKAYQLNSKDAAIIDSMGWIYYKLGKMAIAENYLRKALEIRNDPEIAAHLIEILWEQGRKKDALKVLQAAQNDFPENEKIKKFAEKIK